MKRLLASLALIALMICSVAPVSAHSNTEKAEQIRSEARQKAEERKTNKDARIAAIKAEVAARKLVMKQEKCEARQEKLQERMPKLANSANVIKGVIDKKYDQVQEFYESGQLTVSNYDELVTAVELAKANAETSLEAVNTYTFEIDCENSTVGEQLDSYRTAVKGARESLKNYRKSLVALISSMRAEAAEKDKGTDDSGDETENETETEQDDTTDTPETEVEND